MSAQKDNYLKEGFIPVSYKNRLLKSSQSLKTMPTSTISDKAQVIRQVTDKLVKASVPPLDQSINLLETKYNPYHRVFYPFLVLFAKTDFPELAKLDQSAIQSLSNSPPRFRPSRELPETIMYRGFRVNINQILDNTNYYMKPVDRLAKETGYHGAFIEDFGISFTISDDKLTSKLRELFDNYGQTLAKYKIPAEELVKQIEQQLSKYPYRIGGNDRTKFIKRTFLGQAPPANFLHKLRRDLSQYYKNLGYWAEIRNRDGMKIRKSCDFYFDKGVDFYIRADQPAETKDLVVLKVYFTV